MAHKFSNKQVEKRILDMLALYRKIVDDVCENLCKPFPPIKRAMLLSVLDDAYNELVDYTKFVYSGTPPAPPTITPLMPPTPL